MSVCPDNPGRWGWRSWRWVYWVARQLSALGVTIGWSYGWNGSSRGYVGFGRLCLPGSGSYALWKPMWWWQCHRRQGLRLRGRHRPLEPFAFGVCARCVPCPDCGAPYDCHRWCIQMGGTGDAGGGS